MPVTAGDTGHIAEHNRLATVLASLQTDKLDVTAAALTYTTPAQVTAQINASATGSLRGTYALRPAANTVPSGTIYYCSNIPEMYRSNGTSWDVIGTGGNEVAYAESVSIFSTALATFVDVTGVTVTFTVGERPIAIKVKGQSANSSATGITYVSINLDGAEVGRAQSLGIGADIWHEMAVEARKTGLTAGTSHTAKVQIRTNTATSTTARFGGENSTAPASIQVVTL